MAVDHIKVHVGTFSFLLNMHITIRLVSKAATIKDGEQAPQTPVLCCTRAEITNLAPFWLSRQKTLKEKHPVAMGSADILLTPYPASLLQVSLNAMFILRGKTMHVRFEL